MTDLRLQVDVALAEVDAEAPSPPESSSIDEFTLPAPMTTGDWGPTKQGCDAAQNVLCNAARQARSLCFTTMKPRPPGLVKAAYTAVGVNPGEVTPLSTLVASDYSFANEALTLNKNSSGWAFKVNVIPVPGVFVEDRAKVGFEPSTSHRDPADTLSVRVKVQPHA